MAEIKFKGNPLHTVGEPPRVGNRAPDFKLTRTDLKDVTLTDDYLGKHVVLNVTPSLDTGVCAKSLRRFNELASELHNTVILNVSRDLPFAVARFCGAEDIDNAEGLSSFRDDSFGRSYGLTITDGPMAGLLARAVIVIDEGGVVRHAQLVPEITQEPDYDAALAALER